MWLFLNILGVIIKLVTFFSTKSKYYFYIFNIKSYMYNHWKCTKKIFHINKQIHLKINDLKIDGNKPITRTRHNPSIIKWFECEFSKYKNKYHSLW